MDILAEVVHPVGPHDEGHLHDGNDQNRDTGPICVHDVQYILTSLKRVKAVTANVQTHLLLVHLGDTGQAHEEANKDEGYSDNHFLASEGRGWQFKDFRRNARDYSSETPLAILFVQTSE